MVILRRQDEGSYDIATQLGMTRYKGTVGLEIEVEGNKFKKEALPKPWTYHQDNSLRGKDNAEYVLAEPIGFDDVPGAVDNIYGMMRDFGSILDDSNRTSVHVHLNVQPFFLNRLAALMALYVIFEEVLTEFCGETRVGNLFCLRSKDAPGIITHIRRFVRSDMAYPLRDGLHYAGMNAHAVVKKGSLEFRTLRGTTDPELIKTWVSILRRLYDISKDYPDPTRLCEALSHQGPLEFFHDALGPQAGAVLAGTGFTDDRLRESIYDGVRMAQDICYAKDWAAFRTIVVKPDPFGRDPRKVQKRRASPDTLGGTIDAMEDNMVEMAAEMLDHNPGMTVQQAINAVGGIPVAPPNPNWDPFGNNTNIWANP